MGKYANWAEYEATVPLRYEEAATPEAFLTGLRGIAPPGMRPKPERGEHYGDGVQGKGPMVVSRFREAMFTR
jgi:hypothetical protein